MSTKEIAKNEIYFQKQTFQHYCHGLQAFHKGEYLSAAVWGAVFTEALLKDILTALDISHDGDDLNQMIIKLKKIKNDKTISEIEKNEYLGIAKRCNEIREKRNRIVHDTGTDRGDIGKDAGDIYSNNVEEIVKLYIQTGAADKIRKENQKNQKTDKSAEADADFPIFISTITPHTVEQEIFIETFSNRLRKIGVNPVRCEIGEYDKHDPMSKICRVMDSCQAVIVIGLERCHAYFYRDKEGSQKESEGMHRLFSSAWLQIESGIAAGLGKHIFVLCQKDIHSDGIFDRGWNSYTPLEMDGPLDANNKSVNLLLNEVQEFKKDPKAYLERYKR